MKKILLPGLCAVLSLTVVGSAHAAGAPASVSVEAISKAHAALLVQTPVTTTTAPVVKDGNSAHTCSGTSAGGALELATKGSWTGTWSTSFSDYTVDAILGEGHPFSGGDGNYWSLYVDGLQAQTGACGAELQAGDNVQFYVACGGSSTAACFSGEPVQLVAPKTAKPGTPFSVSVTKSDTSYDSSFNATTAVTPASGAAVGGATTGSDGKASVTLSARGPQTITATLGDRAPSSASVCVTDGADGYCGTTAPGGTPAPAPAPAGPAGPAPYVPAVSGSKITAVKEQQKFAAGKAPRTLGGSVTIGKNGLKDVSIRLTRTQKGKCSSYSGKSERFVSTKKCGAEAGTYFSVGNKADWSYLLPSNLPAGRYVLDVRATDNAGGTDAPLQRGRNRIVFFVS